MHRLAVHNRVGDAEQGPDVGRVAGPPLAEAIGRAHFGQPLRVEATLGAHRHDDGVLDRLRPDQVEHLSSVVLGPVRPADAAAGDRTITQVYTFHLRRVDEELELGLPIVGVV